MTDGASERAEGERASRGDEPGNVSPSGSYPELGGAFTPLYQRLKELGVAARIMEMGKIGPRGRSADFAVDDPDMFLSDLQATGLFCADTRVGRILHPGKISLREDRAAHSLHIAMGTDGRVLAHLDRLSPLSERGRKRACRYSPVRVVAHDMARLWGDLFRLAFGHQLDCAPLLLSLRQAVTPERSCRDVNTGHPGQVPVLGGTAQAPGDPSSRQAGASPPALARRSVLRIPFNVIDEAVYGLDSAAEPWSLHLEVRVSGTLDETRFRRALGLALARHPLARARKAAPPASARSLEWEITAEAEMDPLRIVNCPVDAELGALRSELASLAVPLAESPPLRACLAQSTWGSGLFTL